MTEATSRARALLERMRAKQHDFARKADECDDRGSHLYAAKLAAASEATALWADELEPLVQRIKTLEAALRAFVDDPGIQADTLWKRELEQGRAALAGEQVQS